MQCVDCRFRKECTDHRRPKATCHRHAPQAHTVPAEPNRPDSMEPNYYCGIAVWPEVESGDWCGDFEPVTARMSAPEADRASAPGPKPVEVKPEPKPEPKALEPVLPTAKQALEMAIEYLETALTDFDASYLTVQSQSREANSQGKPYRWRIEAKYEGNDDICDYTFLVNHEGVISME